MATAAGRVSSPGVFSVDAWGHLPSVSERDIEEAGDVAAQIVRLRPRLVRFAWSLTRDHDAAEDLTQEAIARALAAQWRFQPGTNLKAWVFRILRNVHLNAVRSASTRPAVVSIEELVGEPVTHDQPADPVAIQAIERADLHRMAQVYRTLPASFALPLFLTAVEELSYAEAASVLGVPVGTVMSRIYRGRRLLMSRLAGGDT